ncbi:MAG: IS110 family transposase [Acidobacteria bacterium]|nr:IS110 family transposase [Acidobacteriota bacterium]
MTDLPELKEAIEGRFRAHHALVVGHILAHIDHIEEIIDSLSAEIDRVMIPFAKAVELRDTIPGIDKRMAEVLVAEIGIDMSHFPSEHHLASWAAVCPGNNESAGKRKSGRTRRGPVWLRAALFARRLLLHHRRRRRARLGCRSLRRALVHRGHLPRRQAVPRRPPPSRGRGRDRSARRRCRCGSTPPCGCGISPRRGPNPPGRASPGIHPSERHHSLTPWPRCDVSSGADAFSHPLIGCSSLRNGERPHRSTRPRSVEGVSSCDRSRRKCERPLTQVRRIP